MNRRLKNIFIQNTEDVILYKSKSSRGALAKIPARDKNFHGSKLKTMFEQAWSIAKKDVLPNLLASSFSNSDTLLFKI